MGYTLDFTGDYSQSIEDKIALIRGKIAINWVEIPVNSHRSIGLSVYGNDIRAHFYKNLSDKDSTCEARMHTSFTPFQVIVTHSGALCFTSYGDCDGFTITVKINTEYEVITITIE